MSPLVEPEVARPAPPFGGRFPSLSGDLRHSAARGSLINATYLIALSVLGVVKGLTSANFLSTEEYGVWGLLNLALLSVLWLREVGINDKYVQQSDGDQETAFQKAFTLAIAFMGACFLAMVALIGVFAAVYGRPSLIAPGCILATVLLAAGLQFPVWAFYRRMEFAKQRLVQTPEPVIGFSLTVILLVLGFDYWALVLGVVVGGWAGAIATLVVSPYRLRLRFDRLTLRTYVGFSWPIVFSVGTGVVSVQAIYFVGEGELGFAGLGAMALAATFTSLTNKADSIITQTMYPAICAVSHRTDLLLEAFVKSNRLALMWGVPFGCGLALFVDDLIAYVIGEKWHFAAGYLAAVGLASAANHIGFNWHAFCRARGDTRPLAIASAINLAAFVLIQVPLLLAYGLGGLALGIGLTMVPNLLVRAYYLRRIFPEVNLAVRAVRSFAPTTAALAAVLSMRLLVSSWDGPARAVIEVVLYVAITVTVTALMERALLREAIGYMRRSRTSSPVHVQPITS